MNQKNVILVLACVLAANAPCAANQEPEAAGTLISRAQLQQDIWGEGMSPMLMRAEVEVPGRSGAVVHGSYILDWVSPLQWREEIRFADYDRVRVRDAKGYWQRSGLSYQPEIIFQLDNLVHPKELLKIDPKQRLGKVKSRGKDQGQEKCTEVKWEKQTDHVLCFDGRTGTLTSVEYPEGGNQPKPEISRIEFGEFHDVDGKLFPYHMQAYQNRKTVASVKVQQIAKTHHDPSLFNAPVNGEFWEDCDDRQEPELVGRSQPTYPESARSNHEQGRVIFYGVIEKDGSLSRLAIIHRAPASIEAAALEAVRRWRYKPAGCGPIAIRKEISITVDFWLQY